MKKVIAAMTVGKDVRCFDSFITITESDMHYYFPHFLKDDYFDPIVILIPFYLVF